MTLNMRSLVFHVDGSGLKCLHKICDNVVQRDSPSRQQTQQFSQLQNTRVNSRAVCVVLPLRLMS